MLGGHMLKRLVKIWQNITARTTMHIHSGYGGKIGQNISVTSVSGGPCLWVLETKKLT
jgi:hypothetical protein